MTDTGLPTDDARALADKIEAFLKTPSDTTEMNAYTLLRDAKIALRRTAPVAGRDREAVARIIDPVGMSATERSVAPMMPEEKQRANIALDKADAILAIPQPAEMPAVIAGKVLEAAKRMQCLNATLQLKTQCWNEIDEREQQHWSDLASVALSTLPAPVPAGRVE